MDFGPLGPITFLFDPSMRPPRPLLEGTWIFELPLGGSNEATWAPDNPKKLQESEKDHWDSPVRRSHPPSGPPLEHQ